MTCATEISLKLCCCVWVFGNHNKTSDQKMRLSIQHFMVNLSKRLRATLQKTCITGLPVQLC